MHLALAAQLLLAICLGLLTYIPCKVERPWWSPRASAWNTGDMILFRTTDPIFRLSTIITQAEFSHIGVVVAPPDSEYPMIIESLAKGHHACADLWTGRVKDGPQLHPLLKRIREYKEKRGGYAVVRRLRGGTVRPGMLPRIRQFALSVPRFPTYGQMVQSAGLAMICDMYEGLIPLPPPTAVPAETICCSALVAQCYAMWGVMRPTVLNDFIYPRMFEVCERENKVHPTLRVRNPFWFSAGEEIFLPPSMPKHADRTQNSLMRWATSRQSVRRG